MRAVALYSGGLDSLLSMKLIKDQGIDVVALFFDIGFYANIETKKEFLKKGAAQIGVNLEIIDIKEQFFDEILFNPKHGYGKCLNPCIDCHANMIRHAKRLMSNFNANFIITGEVLGQRPKSQHLKALEEVNKLSGADGLILRPLCAKLLPITIPEINGWVDRNKLLDIQGRDRNRQLELAKEYNLKIFETPGGGCLLTNEGFCERIKDLKSSNIGIEQKDIELIKNGRYFRLPDGAVLIVARNKEECDILKAHKTDKFLKIHARDIIGAIGLLSQNSSQNDKELAAKIVLTYSKSEPNKEYVVLLGDEEIVATNFDSKEKVKSFLI